MIVDRINAYLNQEGKTLDDSLRYEIEKIAGWVFKRQFMTETSGDANGTLRLSSAGRCPRQLAYSYHGFEKKGKEIDARAKIVFWTGDLTEFTIVGLAKISGCMITATGFGQLSVDFPVNGTFVKGHPDGLLLHDGKTYLVEIKSMSSYGYKKFEEGVIDDSYLAQINCYLDALNLDECVMVALNKESGVMFERVVKKDMNIVGNCRRALLGVMESDKDHLPDRPFKPDQKTGLLPWQCLYCAYWGHCWNAEKVLVKGKYKLKIKSEAKNETNDTGNKQETGEHEVRPESDGKSKNGGVRGATRNRVPVRAK